INRTTGEVVPVEQWEVDQEHHCVVVHHAQRFDEYTVSFLVYAIWDPTQMYNHITNDWGDKPHEIPFDVRKARSQAYMESCIREFCEQNPDTDVVRFTTFFYHFTLVFNDQGKEKFVDWFGYSASVSTEMLDAFEQEKGYALRPEDFVDQGYYNSTFRVPNARYKDFIDFQQAFVAAQAKKLVDIVHASGKEAMMFLGDNWIGTEPYGKYFASIGLDAVVGSVGSGATLRMISEIPHVKYTEGRFLPYFFPDTFYEGNDPIIEAKSNWLTARRALMRKPLDRIGYGGYLSLAYQFPDFMDYIEHVCDEFRDIHARIDKAKPYCGVTVAILNAWGSLRSWQTHMVAHALWYKQIYSYLGVLECLSGMNVEVRFLSFDEVLTSGIPESVDVIINAGDVGTAFSGGAHWNNPKLLRIIREWVYGGKGFIGIGEPSAYEANGKYFQLASLLGVDKELGFSLSTDKYYVHPQNNHFITQHIHRFDFGEGMKNIYALDGECEILQYANGEVQLATHPYGLGRSVYFAGLPYSLENTHLLQRALYYAANKEETLLRFYSETTGVEVHAYPTQKNYAIVNNTDGRVNAHFYNEQGVREAIELAPCAIVWRTYEV
ncbi:MAG: 1,3-beta-galactosyl-N-acetylhexosamine phosphorylase, partial [Erysipelotrichaceae bacterium]